jgi:hypothetical protein
MKAGIRTNVLVQDVINKENQSFEIKKSLVMNFKAHADAVNNLEIVKEYFNQGQYILVTSGKDKCVRFWNYQ